MTVYGIAGGSSEDRVIAPLWWLAFVPIGTMLVVVVATSLPARLATRIRTADACDTNEGEPRRRGLAPSDGVRPPSGAAAVAT